MLIQRLEVIPTRFGRRLMRSMKVDKIIQAGFCDEAFAMEVESDCQFNRRMGEFNGSLYLIFNNCAHLVGSFFM